MMASTMLYYESTTVDWRTSMLGDERRRTGGAQHRQREEGQKYRGVSYWKIENRNRMLIFYAYGTAANVRSR